MEEKSHGAVELSTHAVARRLLRSPENTKQVGETN